MKSVMIRLSLVENVNKFVNIVSLKTQETHGACCYGRLFPLCPELAKNRTFGEKMLLIIRILW